MAAEGTGADRRARDVLKDAFDEVFGGSAAASGGPDAWTPPERVGPYRILGELGEGGMGLVLRAQQANPRREVAVKLLRDGGLASAELRRRFELEGHVLARLEHDAIARIYDAGVHEQDGRAYPYLVMELVEGAPLAAFARERGLGPRQRIELFARICDGVGYAHDRGVVHRDLKPGNILVTDGGAPKILDFGIARVVAAERAEAREATRTGQILGSLPYMSPEQVSGCSELVQAPSDVFVLGLLLFRLLTGELPFEVDPSDAWRTIRTIEGGRRRKLGAVIRELRGDLETIVEKALEQDPRRRYPTAGALGEDLRRYLRREPIEARAATTLYLAWSFTRRHRWLVAVTSLAIFGLSAGLAVSTRMYLRAEEARASEAVQVTRARSAEQLASRRADALQRQVLVAEGVREFLVGLLDRGNPDLYPLEYAVSLEEALDRSAAQVDASFGGEPAVAAEVRSTVGRAYLGLGRFDDARAELEAAIALHRSFDPRSTELAGALRLLAQTEVRAGRWERARELFEEVVELHAARGERSLAASAEAMLAEPLRLAGEVERAKGIADRATRTLREDPRRDPAEFARALQVLGLCLTDLGRPARAIPCFEEALAISREAFPPTHHLLAGALTALGSARFAVREYRSAEACFAEALEIYRAIHSGPHFSLASAWVNLGVTRRQLGELEGARAAYAAARDAAAGLSDDHPLFANLANNAGKLFLEMGRFEEARAQLEEAVVLTERSHGPDHHETALAYQNLADLHAELGEWEAAFELHAHALAVRIDALGESHPLVAASLRSLAFVERARGRLSAAVEWMRRAVEVRRRLSAAGVPEADLGGDLAILIELARADGRTELAASARRELDGLPGAAGDPPAVGERLGAGR